MRLATMRCPSCHQNIRVQGRYCPRCGEQIFGLRRPAAPADSWELPAAGGPLPPPLPPAPAWGLSASDLADAYPAPPLPPGGEVLDIELEEVSSEPSVLSGSGNGNGRTCPYCRFPVEAGETARVCPVCAVPHHRECWLENQGCTTYGCQESPQVAGSGRVTLPPLEAGYPLGRPGGSFPREATALVEAQLDGLASSALLLAFLGLLCYLPSLLGLLTGISVLNQVHRSGCSAPGARAKAWTAVIISAIILCGPLLLLLLAAARNS